MDVVAVPRRRRCGRPSIARSGKGPYILEMKTYRYRGHSMSDPAKYRTQRRDGRDAQDPRPHRSPASDELEGAGVADRGPQGHRRRGPAVVLTPPSTPAPRPSPTRPNFTRTSIWRPRRMTDILMPALSPTMEEGTLAKWLVKAGDTVRSGDVIAEIETDKATMEVEAVDEGVVRKPARPGGNRGGEGQHAHRPAERRRGRDPGCGAPPPERRQPRRRPPADKPATAGRGTPRRRTNASLPRGQATLERPPGTTFTKTTVRDALRDAMAEEMRRDPRRLPDRRGGRPVPGRLQGQPRPACRSSATSGLSTRRSPSTASRASGVGAAMAGPEAHRRVHDLQLRHAGD